MYALFPDTTRHAAPIERHCMAILAMCFALMVHGQAARLVLNNNAWVRIDNGAWVVLDNPNANALTTLGSGGNLRSEGEFDRLRWHIGGSTGTYVVPFTSAAGVKIPLTCTVVVPGAGGPGASICFSTYNHVSAGIPLANAWNNFLYMPSDVWHMNSYNAPSVPNSQNAVDRFWTIDSYVPGYAYTVRPSVVLDFTYDPGAVSGELTPGNVIGPLDPVGAQRFNAPAGLWGDMLPIGTWVPGSPSAVVGAVVPPGQFHRSWTLANVFDPLPVSLIGFTAECATGTARLAWTTATETNSAWYVLERATDSEEFKEAGRVRAAGHSTELRTYAWEDPRTTVDARYRLRMEDDDGTFTWSTTLMPRCGAEPAGHFRAWDGGSALFVWLPADAHDRTVEVLDARGRLLHMQQVPSAADELLLTVEDRWSAAGMVVVRVVGPGHAEALRVPVLR